MRTSSFTPWDLLLLTTAVTSAAADDCRTTAAQSDLVTSLPGWDGPLPSDWYSGYVDYDFQGVRVHSHYVFVEADDDDDNDEQENKPLLYWSNGGPGASSMFGLLTELGPLLLSDASLDTDEYRKTGVPSLLFNEHAWTRLGSVLILDQTPPVGFSYCDDGDHHESSEQHKHKHDCGGIRWTDELASLNVYTALQAWFDTKFPCLRNRELYLAGESYAGVYIPTLARRMVEDAHSTMNLRGFALGDACLGKDSSICGRGEAYDYWHALFLAGHGQMPLQDYKRLMRDCHHYFQDETTFLTTNSEKDETCRATLAEVTREVGGYYVYGLYDECTYRNGLSLQGAGRRRRLLKERGALNDYPCGGGLVLSAYLQLDAVKQALHVTASDFFETDNGEGIDYTPTEPDVTGFVRDVNGHLRVLVYNGDTDPSITSFAAQNWTSHLGLAPEEPWRPWTVDGCQRVAGYVTRYEGGLDFVTIRGAGHMVPTYKAAASYVMLRSWLLEDEGGGGYPTYDAKCVRPTTTSDVTSRIRNNDVSVTDERFYNTYLQRL